MKIAFLTDIHEDIVSLKKALKMIELEKCDSIICLGDILGYPIYRGKYEHTRNVSECVELIKTNCSNVILGNHDLFHLNKFPEFSIGFKFPKNWYQLSAEEKIEISNDKVWNYSDDYQVLLSATNMEYLSSLPEFELKEFAGNKILLSHFVHPNFSGYVTTYHGEGKKLRSHFDYLNKNNCKLSICGHMHIEGLGICYEPGENLLSHLFKGFVYYSYGEKEYKNKACSITIPALADNGQVNGFAVLDFKNSTIKAISLNTNRRFIL